MSVEHPKPLDELQSYELLERVGIPHAPAVAYEANRSLPFRYPAVLKVLSAEIPHKSDVGGVVLGISSDASLKKAAAKIQSAFPGHRMLVQQQVDAVGEVLVGFRRDVQVGPIVLLASGGLMTEVVGSRSLRLAPVDLDAARAMIDEVSELRVLRGYRGKPPGDLEALARAIVAISGLAADATVAELEVNPLLVRRVGEGVLAVDALARVSARRSPPPRPAGAKAARARRAG